MSDNEKTFFVRNIFQMMILKGLNATGKHIYAGTVDPEEIRRRRKANKAARIQRRKNRK